MSAFLKRLGSIAEEHAGRLAHSGGGAPMTYREMWGRASALANRLERTHPPDGLPVGIRGHKQPEMLVGFLGAALAGRAYIPIDISTPEARVERIITTAKPAAVLSVEEITRLTNQWELAPARTPPDARDDDPFYVMFTSGSTGDPKGVVITHGCLDAFVRWMIAEQNLAPGAEVFLNQAPYSFDLSVMDLYLSLSTGGTHVSITKEDLANPRELYGKLRSGGITTWVSTPSFVQMCLAERSFDSDMLPALRRFLFCGETLPHKTAATLSSRFPATQIWNTYGPTEATVATTSVHIDAAVLAHHDPLPIGHPMPGTEVTIMRPDGSRAADGESGEITIAGPNVSPGYLNRPELTGKVFFHENGRRGYRTGDRGHAKNGLLYFSGRRDFQIKLRGHRIELGDVEAHIRAIPGVVDAVVLPVERRGVIDSLAAFVVTREPAGADTFAAAQSLRQALAPRIPEYMIPRRVDFIDAFPLTENGKADRNALAARLA